MRSVLRPIMALLMVACFFVHSVGARPLVTPSPSASAAAPFFSDQALSLQGIGVLRSVLSALSFSRLLQIAYPGWGRASPTLTLDQQALLEKRLNRIEESLRALESQQRPLDLSNRLLEIELLELQMLHDAGILGPHRRVFIPLAGADPFPAKGAEAVWTADFKLYPEDIRGHFLTWESWVRRASWRSYAEDIPFIGAEVNNLEHTRSDILAEPVLEEWVSHMRPGDVVFLKFTHIWFIQWNRVTSAIPHWYERLVRLIPEGVALVILDTPHPMPTTPFQNPIHLADYLLSRYPDLLEDTLDAQLPGFGDRLRAIDDHPRMKNGYLESGYLVFELGGQLRLLTKRGKGIASKPQNHIFRRYFHRSRPLQRAA